MPDLIFALLSGVVGSLIIAVIPQVRNRLKTLLFVFLCSRYFFSWRVAIAVFAGESAEISGEIGGFPFVLSPDH